MIVLIILGCLLLFMLVIVLSLLLIPFDYSASGEKYQKAFMLVRLSLLFGGVKIDYGISTDGTRGHIRVLGVKFPIKPVGHHKDKKEEIERKEKENEKEIHVNYLKKDFIERVLEAIGDLFDYIKPRKFEVNGCFGFDEPYNTSMLWLCILALPLHHKNININLTPIFYEEILEGRFIIEGRIVLAVLLWIAVKLRLSRPVKNILMERKRRRYVT